MTVDGGVEACCRTAGPLRGYAEDISARDLADIEKGVEVAGIGVYRSLAAALGVTVDDLIVPEA